MTQAQKWHLSLPCIFSWLKLYLMSIPEDREEAQNTYTVNCVPGKKKKTLWRIPGSFCHIYLTQQHCSRIRKSVVEGTSYRQFMINYLTVFSVPEIYSAVNFQLFGAQAQLFNGCDMVPSSWVTDKLTQWQPVFTI